MLQCLAFERALLVLSVRLASVGYCLTLTRGSSFIHVASGWVTQLTAAQVHG